MIPTHCLHLSQDNKWRRSRIDYICLPVIVPLWLGSVYSLHRYVKNAKLDKDQQSGYTESHKDVQCLEVEGAEGGQRRKGMMKWEALGSRCMDKGVQRRKQVWRGKRADLICGCGEKMKTLIKRGTLGTFNRLIFPSHSYIMTSGQKSEMNRRSVAIDIWIVGIVYSMLYHNS